METLLPTQKPVAMLFRLKKKLKEHKIIVAIILFILFFKLAGFHFSEAYFIGRNIPFEKINTMKDYFWKYTDGYHDGYHVGDFLEFGEYYEVKKDTLYSLYKGRHPEAKVIKLVHRAFISYELTIQSFDGQKNSYYIGKLR